MTPNKLVATGGQKHINASDGAQTDLGVYCFIAQEDTVISLLKGGPGTTSDISINYLTTQNLSGKTLKQGAQIFCPEGENFNSITVSSGSIIAYKL